VNRVRRGRRGFTPVRVAGDPLWYKDAIIYEVHVRSFVDSDGDGIGDFPGLTGKLDYIRDLGVSAVWLLPFYPSPLRDDGYDIADYTAVHPTYGTMRDFRMFLRAAHERGLRVITELVLNHTSERHPWFDRARRAEPGTRWRDFYVWSDTPDRYRDARIIFKDFESSNWTLDPLAKTYYWHRFYSHQPDLNYDSPDVRRAMLGVVDFWLEQGVDGLRLDAVPYLYEREGTTCENLPETHAFLKELRRHVDERHPGRMLLAEANQWPEDAIAYFGSGDECHMAFHFPLMPRLFMAIHMEDRFPIFEILQQTPPIPETAQWALFLRNHDELTLEMVTDEDRDYMYRVYAQDPSARINLGIRRRLAPLLGNHRRRIELMLGLLFSIPGTPVVYYGDEIGMGDNIYLGDREGVRTPMQWSADRNAGFSRANPQRLYAPVVIDPEYHYETVNVEAQQNNTYSLLWWVRRLVALRKRFRAFGRGTIEFLQPDNRKVVAFLRRNGEEMMLVVANLSRFVQYVELPLAEFRGMVPVEVFGRTAFPRIGEPAYLLTLGPHAFYWFALELEESVVSRPAGSPDAAAPLSVAGSWERVLHDENRPALEEALPGYLRGRRWFGGKARRIRATRIRDVVRLSTETSMPHLLLLDVSYLDADADTYVLPLGFAPAQPDRPDQPSGIPLRVLGDDRPVGGVLYDAVDDRDFCRALLDAIAHRRRLRGGRHDAVATPTSMFRKILPHGGEVPDPAIVRADQSNTSVVFGDRFLLKLFRRVEPGTNPDLEVGRFLTERAAFSHVPAVAGAIEYASGRPDALTMAILHQFVPNEGDAWRYTQDVLGRYYERMLTQSAPPGRDAMRAPEAPLLELAARDLPDGVAGTIGEYVDASRLLGQRTAELHAALASSTTDADFAPEPFTAPYQRSLYQSMRTQAREALQMLRRGLRDFPPEMRDDAERVVEAEDAILLRFRPLLERKIDAMRIRVHGDYHLGQVLHTGKDFVIIDLEGEPARTLSARRAKRPCLYDVAGMLRSFQYATAAALRDQMARGAAATREAQDVLEAAAPMWERWVSAIFLRGYLDVAGQEPFMTRERDVTQALLDAHLLEKALYELVYEINHRPDWVRIPLRGILSLIGQSRPR
jgi:maltose alpha-D-glucosyltransferase / alpha-amylase